MVLILMGMRRMTVIVPGVCRVRRVVMQGMEMWRMRMWNVYFQSVKTKVLLVFLLFRKVLEVFRFQEQVEFLGRRVVPRPMFRRVVRFLSVIVLPLACVRGHESARVDVAVSLALQKVFAGRMGLLGDSVRNVNRRICVIHFPAHRFRGDETTGIHRIGGYESRDGRGKPLFQFFQTRRK